MASIITVKISYEDGSKSLSEQFGCADTHPSAPMIQDLERIMRDKWYAMGGTGGVRINTTIRQA